MHDDFSGSIYAHREIIGEQYGVLNYDGDRNAIALSYDFEALAADSGFINALSQIDFIARFKLEILYDQLNDIRDLRDELAKRLKLEGNRAP
jgi:hypothetical protein